MIEFELTKKFKADFTITDREILELSEEYQNYYKTLNEIRMLREQRQELFDEYSKKISEIQASLPQLETFVAPPEGYYTAQQISYLVSKDRSIIGKLTSQKGLKENAIKAVTSINADGVKFKYFYGYAAVIAVGDFYEIWVNKPDEEELKKIMELLKNKFEYNCRIKPEDLVWMNNFVTFIHS